MPAKKVRIVSRTPAPRPEVEYVDSNLEPDDTDTDTDDTTDDTSTDDSKDTKAKKETGDVGAQQILEAFGGVDFLTALVGDTDVKAILDARRAGTKTRVMLDGEPNDPVEEVEDPVDEATEDLDDDLKKVVKALRSDIKSQLQPLTDEVNALKSIAGTYQKQAVNTQIQTVAGKFKDFNKYRKPMAQLARDHPGLAVKELYILAKSQANELEIAEKSTESERPTPTPRRRAAGGRKQLAGVSAASSGRRQWNEALASALDNIEFVED